MPGRFLHRLAHGCSDRVRLNVLEPLIADFQHEWSVGHSLAGGIVLLGRGYGAFWRSFVWCFACDAVSRESSEFRHRAAAAFVLAVAATAALEWLVIHTNSTVRNLVMRNIKYLWLSAHSGTVTLRYGVPLAMFPAMAYARTWGKHRAPAADVATIAVGTLLTIASSGWLAPAVERRQLIREHEDFVRGTHGRIYTLPLDVKLATSPMARSWPALIRGAVEAAPHRFPGYPWYDALEDKSAHDDHWWEIRERVFITVIGVLVAWLGWTLGAHGVASPALTIGWWLVVSAIATEGQRGGLLLPLVGIVAAIAVIAFGARRTNQFPAEGNT
jgi:hypothetical protein